MIDKSSFQTIIRELKEADDRRENVIQLSREIIKESKLINYTELGVDINSYLMGLCDLTGELLRKAVKDVIEHKYESARDISMVVEEIYGLFLQLDLRNGPLRQKSDSIKWNLQKLEHLLLDISRK